MLKDKNIILGISGGIAAYKIASLASSLKKEQALVDVIMTNNATKFITPLTFETLTGRKTMVDTFDRMFSFEVEHIETAKRAQAVLIAPATANIIAKLAHGLADDMLSTTVLAVTCPVIVAPSMNTRMFMNPIVQDNLKRLREYGFEIIPPDSGYLACGDTGAGKMPEPRVLLEYLKKALWEKKDLKGKRVLITSGPTMEAIDPVRFISNHSTGKMGTELAKAAACRGAQVTLITGRTQEYIPDFIRRVDVVSAEEMYHRVMEHEQEADIVLGAAAVADYTPREQAEDKIKKGQGEWAIPLKRTRDILKELAGVPRPGRFICGFSMETRDMLENSKRKLEEKHFDMIVANNLKQEGAGFGTETNVVTLITKEDMLSLERLSKAQVAHRILDEIIRRIS